MVKGLGGIQFGLKIVMSNDYRQNLMTRSPIFLYVMGQEARNSSCDWCIKLSDNRYPVTPLCHWILAKKGFCCQINKK